MLAIATVQPNLRRMSLHPLLLAAVTAMAVVSSYSSIFAQPLVTVTEVLAEPKKYDGSHVELACPILREASLRNVICANGKKPTISIDTSALTEEARKYLFTLCADETTDCRAWISGTFLFSDKQLSFIAAKVTFINRQNVDLLIQQLREESDKRLQEFKQRNDQESADYRQAYEQYSRDLLLRTSLILTYQTGSEMASAARRTTPTFSDCVAAVYQHSVVLKKLDESRLSKSEQERKETEMRYTRSAVDRTEICMPMNTLR